MLTERFKFVNLYILTDMEINIIKDFDNRLMKRKELVVEIDYGGGATPSKAELQKFFATKFAAEPNRVEISKIMSSRGYARGRVWIKIWDEPKVEVLFKEEKESAGEGNAEKAGEQEQA